MNRIAQVLIFLLFILEVLLLTYYMEVWSVHTSALVLLVTSLMIGILGIRTSATTADPGPEGLSNMMRVLISILVCVIGTLMVGDLLADIFATYTIDKRDNSRSDVIPLVIAMVERFLEGSFPYAPYSFSDYTLRPTYMPLIWMPFTLAEVLEFDYRWVPFALIVTALTVLQFSVIRRCTHQLLFIFLSLLPWALLYTFVILDPDLFTVIIENINVAYYVLFCICLLSRKPVIIGLGLACCLLSRYSFALWVPFLGLVYLIHDWRKLLWIVGTSATALLLFYVLPFLSQDPSMFFDSLASYTAAAQGEWAPVWQAEGAKPFHLFRGIGVAGIFYEHAAGDILTKIKTLQFWHYFTSIAVLVPLFIAYIRLRHRVTLPIFLIASLKIYFVFFYSFIQVPYSYLFMVPTFVSLILVILTLVRSKKTAASL